jgi:hypothetical protein
MLWDGYGPNTHPGALKPPLVGGHTLPKGLFREYTNWANQARWVADVNLGMPRHSGGDHAVYLDLHVKWVHYGQGNTTAERLASVERAFPFAHSVAPTPPLPLPGPRDFWSKWEW